MTLKIRRLLAWPDPGHHVLCDALGTFAAAFQARPSLGIHPIPDVPEVLYGRPRRDGPTGPGVIGRPFPAMVHDQQDLGVSVEAWDVVLEVHYAEGHFL